MKVGKVILVGSADVGKTSLIRKFLDKKFDHPINTTVSPSLFCCIFTAYEETICMEVWDTAGQEKFRSILHFYLRDINVALIVFDITKFKTFLEAKAWANEITYNCQKPINLILVGNKKDLSDRREISKKEALTYAKKIGAIYLESSAKNSSGVCRVFSESAKGILKAYKETQETEKKETETS